MTANNVFMFTKATHSNGKRVDMTPTVEFCNQVRELNERYSLSYSPKDFQTLAVQMYNRRINGCMRGHHQAFSARMVEFNYKKGRLEFLKEEARRQGVELTAEVTDQLCKIVRETDPVAFETWGNELLKLRWGRVA